MERLLLLINSLPKVLQDFIHEYNVEHRPKMKKVLSRLLEYKPQRRICEVCDIGKLGMYSVIPFNFVCSKKCLKEFVSLIPDECPDKYYYQNILKKMKKNKIN